MVGTPSACLFRFSFSVSLFLLVLALVRGNYDGWASGKILGLKTVEARNLGDTPDVVAPAVASSASALGPVVNLTHAELLCEG